MPHKPNQAQKENCFLHTHERELLSITIFGDFVFLLSFFVGESMEVFLDLPSSLSSSTRTFSIIEALSRSQQSWGKAYRPRGPRASTNNVWKERRPRRCCLAADREVAFPRPRRFPQNESASCQRENNPYTENYLLFIPWDTVEIIKASDDSHSKIKVKNRHIYLIDV